MIWWLTIEQVEQAREECSKCPLSTDPYFYCTKYKTDSMVFKFDKCKKLEKYVSKNQKTQ